MISLIKKYIHNRKKENFEFSKIDLCCGRLMTFVSFSENEGVLVCSSCDKRKVVKK